MLRRLLPIMLLLVLALVLVLPTFAQDVTPEPTVYTTATVAPAEQPPVVVVNPPGADPTDRALYVLGLIVFLAFSGIASLLHNRRVDGLIDALNKAMGNKEFRDEARERYMRSSLETQEFVKLLQGIAGFAGALNIPVVDPAIDKAKETLDDITASDGSPFGIYGAKQVPQTEKPSDDFKAGFDAAVKEYKTD